MVPDANSNFQVYFVVAHCTGIWPFPHSSAPFKAMKSAQISTFVLAYLDRIGIMILGGLRIHL
jgi:hypothetical protein